MLVLSVKRARSTAGCTKARSRSAKQQYGVDVSNENAGIHHRIDTPHAASTAIVV